MKSMIETIKRSWILTVILTVALGLVLLMYPDTTGKVLCYMVGGLLLVHGILNLVRYFTRDEEAFSCATSCWWASCCAPRGVLC